MPPPPGSHERTARRARTATNVSPLEIIMAVLLLRFTDITCRRDYAHRVLRVAYDGLRMVKANLVHRVLEVVDLDSPAAQDAVDALLECIGSALERGDRVVLRRFGVFHAAPRKTGMARNPRTNETVPMPRGRVVRFRPAVDLRN
ncbi:MAG: integration host factor subunit beta [Acidobacteria bacterium]|nr:integration host factor subunit beta [Acidobacteriota bacterium]